LKNKTVTTFHGGGAAVWRHTPSPHADIKTRRRAIHGAAVYNIYCAQEINKVKIFKVKFFKSFLDEAFGFIGYAGLTCLSRRSQTPHIKSKSKSKAFFF
jgi:hypothetical protein